MSGILLTRHAVPKIGCLSPGSTDVCPPKNNPPSLFMEKGPGDEVSLDVCPPINHLCLSVFIRGSPLNTINPEK